MNKFNIIVVAPALNEENCLPDFAESIKKQTKIPTEIVIVDNDSSDGTAKLAKSHSCTVLSCKTEGIGPARSIGVNYVLKKYKNSLNKTIIIQLDCDEEITNSDYITKVEEAYLNNKNLMVTTGPVRYEVKFKNNYKKTIETGKQFRKIFYVKTLAELFTDSGRNINDYLLPAKNHKFFTGGNTTYRASVFQLSNVNFPQDKSWESIVISVRIQQRISENQIRFIEEQEVATSGRSFTNSMGIITPNKLKTIRKEGYIRPFKSRNSLSPQQTINNLIYQIDKETYNLSDSEYIERVVSSSDRNKLPRNCRVLPMLHASTLGIIPNKLVIIKKN